MTRSIVCVTNSVPDLRSCTLRNVHTSLCDGVARRYDVGTRQTILVTRTAIGDDGRILRDAAGRALREYVECTGCMPRPASTGQLCEAHQLKVEQALEYDADQRLVLVDLVTHMWSIESGGVADDNTKVSGAFGSQWTLSESHILANAIYQELASTAVAIAIDERIPEPRFSPAASILDGFAIDLDVDIVGILIRDLVEWIAAHTAAAKHRHTAERMVRLVNITQAALMKFPLVDVEHRVPFVRCPNCARMTMVWRPPLMAFDDVLVKCERCGHEEDQAWLESYIAAVKTDPRRARV